jgi:predicted secreted protein
MASTGVINGTLLAIYVGAVKIDVQKSCTVSMSHDVRTYINKDSAGWENAAAGKKSWEMSGEADFKIDATYGLSQLFTAYVSGTEVALKFQTAVSGDGYLYGNAQVSKLDWSAGTEETGTMSYAFKGNGILRYATV